VANWQSVPNGSDNPVISGAATPLDMGVGDPGFTRTEPLITIERIKDEYLFGIPLVASLTGQELPERVIRQAILKAVGDVETSIHIPVQPVRVTDRFDFERADDIQFGLRQLTKFPVLKIENLKALWPGRNDIMAGIDNNQTQEVDYPTSWVTLQGDRGIFRVVPNTGSIVNADASFIASSAYRSIILGGLKSWPNMWRVTYIAGFESEQVPVIVNDLIGVMAAIRLLAMLGPAIFPVNAQAVGIDGMSQSTSTAGPQWLANRVGELNIEKDRLTTSLKAYYGTDVYFSAW
jgi:hypothetical protein